MATPAAITPNPNYSSASLYVGDLAQDVTEAIIFDTFNNVGPVASVRVCRDAATRRSLGYAYVNFHRVEDAERARETMNFKDIRGRPCRIMWSHRDPSLRKSGVGNIFVNNLAPSIDNKTLYDTFSMFGNILSCKVATSKKGESLGYGFVHYESQEAAENAIERVDKKMISELQVSVTAFKAKKDRGGPNKFTNIYIKNIPTDFTEEKLRSLFKKFGAITSSKLSKAPEAKAGKNLTRYGFINFKEPEQAEKAVAKMNDFKIGKKDEDRPLFVGPAMKKDERERQLRRKHDQERLERQKQYRGVNLYVKNLADNIDHDRLNQEFSKFGIITSAKVMMDKQTGKTRGFGFVCFSTPEEATKALSEMNQRMLEGKPLYVAMAQRREERRAQLEAQYASRGRVPGGQMGYPGGVFYPGMQRPVMYPPQQMVPGRWGMQRGPQMMQPGVPGARMNFQLMPMQQQGRGQQRGRGGRRGGKQMQGGRQDQSVMYNHNVRNQQQQQMAQQMPPQQQAPQQQQQAAQPAQQQPLHTILANAPDEKKKQILGERLFPLVQARQGSKAGKITGMLLEMDNAEVIHLLESSKALEDNIQEALNVLDEGEEEESDEESDEESEEES